MNKLNEIVDSVKAWHSDAENVWENNRASAISFAVAGFLVCSLVWFIVS